MNNASTLHPGQILNDQFLIPKQMSIKAFAKQTGITENHIKDLISGRRWTLLVTCLNIKDSITQKSFFIYINR